MFLWFVILTFFYFESFFFLQMDEATSRNATSLHVPGANIPQHGTRTDELVGFQLFVWFQSPVFLPSTHTSLVSSGL